MPMRINPARKIKLILGFFIAALVISGLTAIPLQWEVGFLERFFSGPGAFFSSIFPSLDYWLARVFTGIRETFTRFPFMAYSTDWLAFGIFGIIPLHIARKAALELASQSS